MGVVEPVNKHSPCSQRGARREGNASSHGTWTISCTTPCQEKNHVVLLACCLFLCLELGASMFRSRLPGSVDLQPPCRVRQIFGPPVVEGFTFTRILASTLSI